MRDIFSFPFSVFYIFELLRYLGKSAGAGLRSDAVALFGSLPIISPQTEFFEMHESGLWPNLPSGVEFIGTNFPRYL